MWDFRTEESFQEKLDWATEFIRTEVARMDACFGNPYDKTDADAMASWRKLKAEVQECGLWGVHLPRSLGGAELSRVECALLNERFAWSRWAPIVFGCIPTQSRLALALLKHGAPELASRYARPLLECEISAAYGMNEPIVGATKQLFATRAARSGAGWTLNGAKWFIQNASQAELLLVVAVTNTRVNPTEGLSIFAVPAGTPGLRTVREMSIAGQSLDGGLHGAYGYLELEDVQLPAAALVGREGAAYAVLQSSNDPFDLHSAARAVGQAREAFDRLCERAVSFETRSGALQAFQFTKEAVASCRIQIEQLRLLVLKACWSAEHRDAKEALEDVLAVRIAFPEILRDVVRRAMHLHGALGVSSEMPFGSWLAWAEAIAVAEGPVEVNRLALGGAILKRYPPPATRDWPEGHLPSAQRRFGCAPPGAPLGPPTKPGRS